MNAATSLLSSERSRSRLPVATGSALFFILLVLIGLLAPSGAGALLPAEVDDMPLPSLAPMLERTTPAVVNIATRGRAPVRQSPLLDDPFFRRFFDVPDQPRERQTQSLGSGVIVDAGRGLVITNHHVVHRADQITVTLADGREFSATLVGSDAETDVAVIRIEADDLTALPLADSDQLRVGDFVVAIGNPFGLGQTVTSGIVSALGRSGLKVGSYEDFIQTDASINPGNSGGALVNLRGELVGINTAILAPSGGNIGIGFAIPTNMAMAVTHQLVEHGEISRGQLGIGVQDLTPALAEAFGLDTRNGVVVTQITPGSPAERAGLQTGDILQSLNGRPVRQASELRNSIALLRVGDTVELEVRRNGSTRTIRATVDSPESAVLDGRTLSPRLAGASFGYTDVQTSQGPQTRLRVETIEAGSAAHRAGLRTGDIVLSVNRQAVQDADAFRRAAAGQRELLLHVQRGNGAMFILLR